MEIELDAKFIVDLVSSTKITIRIISHKCADAFVTIGTKQLMDFVLFDTPPLGVVNAFNSDFNAWVVLLTDFVLKLLLLSH